MQIKTLRKAFERALPYYQKAIDEQWKYIDLYFHDMDYGLCHFLDSKLNVDVYPVFSTHYKNFILCHRTWLFPTPSKIEYHEESSGSILRDAIQPRLEFLKEEIKRLKKLEKKGYTHV
jgi:hypothetical protein